jgi:hypothetical protein
MSKILLRRFVEKIFVTRNGFFGEELFLKLPNANKISYFFRAPAEDSAIIEARYLQCRGK